MIDVARHLAVVGIDAGTAAELIDHGEGSLDPEDLATDHATGAPAGVLLAALVASRRAVANVASLRAILDWLEDQLGELSRFDVGRYWHLVGLVAFRVDKLVFIASRALNRSTEMLGAEGSPRARAYRARVHDTFGQLLHQQGMLQEAAAELELSLRLRAPDDVVGRGITLGNLGRLYMDTGEFVKARAHLEADLELLRRTQATPTRWITQIQSHLGECNLRLDKLDKAEGHYRDSEKTADDPLGRSYARLGLARIALHKGMARAAMTAAQEVLNEVGAALRLIQPAQAAGVRALASKLAGDAALALRDYSGASMSFARAHDFVVDSDASPIDRAEILHGMARAHLETGRASDALDKLRLALRALDATSADPIRRLIESDLKKASRDQWLLHAASRFIGGEGERLERFLDDAGRGGFQGSKRDMVVLFSDIRGFTSLSEDLGPEELVVLLNDFLAAMTRCIEHYGGSVDKFIGDAVMAVFPAFEGATRFDPVAAALAMREELHRVNRKIAASKADFKPLSIGIGINAGEVVSGLIGSPLRRSLTVIGDAVNTASRLEGMTKQVGAGIVVTEPVLAHTDRDKVLPRPIGVFAPKGRKKGVKVFAVIGFRDKSPASVDALHEIANAEAALEALCARRWDDAIARYGALVSATAQHDRAKGYRLLLSRAQAFRETPPDTDWSGEIALDSK